MRVTGIQWAAMSVGDGMEICPAGCRGLPEGFPTNGMYVLDVAYSVPTRVVRALYTANASLEILKEDCLTLSQFSR